ncbi:MBL fold metallo-hydrolase [Bacillus taeanensis]|uniref:MBL fold metallo-hydrolase n=1 Tax=Bacillus taeanensis TaxID=273032 RepID=A0A366XUP9_9BACI|nr:MBL fold metallo-hydrolase [Bacillus taeanensis]RBW70110.1 MBL fold metallo-hydrolase [Bacillus taeanensis]
MIKQLRENLFRLAIPVPFPMKYVYCYLFKMEQEVILIDTGFSDQPAKEAWLHIFSELNIDPKQVTKIYLTHFHPDHSGLSGWMQQLTGAKVYMSQTDMAMFTHVFMNGNNQAKQIGEMAVENGVPIKLADNIAEHMNELTKHIAPLPNFTELTEKKILLGDKRWEVIAVPGHSDGHVCFYEPEEELLIAGDHILDKITPNISLWPGGSDNPLKNYFHSLKLVSKFSVKEVFPAHGEIILNLKDRIDKLLCHHDERLKKMELLAARGCTAYEVAVQTFNAKKLTAHQWRFAMAETLAHLEYLVRSDKLRKKTEDNVVYYEGNKHKIVV